MARDSLRLRYGLNPHQEVAEAYVEGRLPLRVVNGEPSYINLVDALQGWQLVKELKATFRLPAVASFKHTTPAGASLGLPLSPVLTRAYRCEDIPLSPLACAYARARGTDRMASFGDFVAVSDAVDKETAHLIGREVSDGIIAPSYEPSALDRLRKKKQGQYLVLEMDPEWMPSRRERRDVYGITLEQSRNDAVVTEGQAVSRNTALDTEARRNILLAAIVLKYTPSNSVCVTYGGQTVGVGAGQQSRIQCTRLACDKADNWWLRQNPRVLELPFRAGASRPEQDNATDALLNGAASGAFRDPPTPLTLDERREWRAQLKGLAMASDGFIPFRDNIDRAAQSGVGYVWEPGGSSRDAEVIRAADEHGMVLLFSGLRLFHH
jgi:phosphoribosylaminoimidazolecarboxamide formyltransferase/IMP cyclohydrolase